MKIRKILVIVLGIIIGLTTVVVADNILSTRVIHKNDKTVQQELNELYEKASHLDECPSGYNCNKISYSYLPEDDTNTYTQSEFVQNLNVGDYIQMTPSGTSFQTVGNKTGDDQQTINPQELTLWRVIRKNTNGTVDVVSEYVSSVDVYFQGATGYIFFIGYLNELASHYENPAYTIGSRHMGYSGQTELISNPKNINGQTGAPWTSNTSSSTTAANEVLGAGDMGYQADYNLVKEVYGNTSGSAKAYKVGTTTYTKYGLASRYYAYENYSSFVIVSIYGRYVSEDGSVDNGILTYYNSNSYWAKSRYAYALRPILTLKADITKSISDTEDGSKDHPYVLE